MNTSHVVTPDLFRHPPLCERYPFDLRESLKHRWTPEQVRGDGLR